MTLHTWLSMRMESLWRSAAKAWTVLSTSARMLCSAHSTQDSRLISNHRQRAESSGSDGAYRIDHSVLYLDAAAGGVPVYVAATCFDG